MDRETILKHSRAVRLENKLLPDFTDLIIELCNRKAHPEHIPNIIQLLSKPVIREHIINSVLEYFEKEFHIIKIERLPNLYEANIKHLINII